MAKPNADREEACPTADSPPRTLSIGDRVTRHVPAEAPDGLTGVLVEDGAAYRLEANGTTRDASLAETTPEGYAPNSSGFGFELFRLFGQHKLRYPSAAWFELVGFVATDSQPANYFAIGRGVAEWKPERVGELYGAEYIK